MNNVRLVQIRTRRRAIRLKSIMRRAETLGLTKKAKRRRRGGKQAAALGLTANRHGGEIAGDEARVDG